MVLSNQMKFMIALKSHRTVTTYNHDQQFSLRNSCLSRSRGRACLYVPPTAREKRAALRGLWLFFSRGWFWGYEETRGLNVSCLSVQGSASVIAPVLLRNTSAR